ncbi:DUF2312 domain-containing protein [Xanthobacter dioxanivorans]|uniref:DUF2312 domain-containing protein n=1 Tax=Xanthobacter dioxanivorans TaxID=2528964 RepID=A0A974PM71_9HYPH|nr:DUF2312 domain-containing protein [Xanthobacter dioxanivorans]QRG06119.1 DUF2312 domain-containing protein [Xanthobacter dioxanivorans]
MTGIGDNSEAGAGLVKSFVDRILRLKEEQDAIGDDVKDVYAEAKSQGLDKTALGKVVAKIRANQKNPDKYAETEALVELYMNAVEAEALTHARA